MRTASAYGWSIIAMMASPFVILGILGTVIYRGIKKAQVSAGSAD